MCHVFLPLDSRGQARDGIAYGPLTDLPDWSFAGKRPMDYCFFFFYTVFFFTIFKGLQSFVIYMYVFKISIGKFELPRPYIASSIHIQHL